MKKAALRLISRNSWFGLVLVSVVATFFSYPPHPLGLLMLVGLAPLFIAIDTAPTWKSAAFRAWVYVFVGNSAICWWIAFSVHEYVQLPWGLSYPFIFLLSAVEQSAWPVIAGLRHVLHRRFDVRPLLWTPAALMAFDSIWPKFFPNTMGNVFYDVPVLRQVADVIGVWGLTALLVATNETCAALVLRRWPRRDLARHAITTAVLLAAAFGYGAWRLDRVHELMRAPERKVRVALIQPNIGDFLKLKAEQGSERGFRIVLDKLGSLSRGTLKDHPTLVIWPETAYPTFYHSHTQYEDAWRTQQLDDLATSLGVPLLTGGYDGDGEDRYNSSFLITPRDGKLDLQRYHKTLLLVPIERVPIVQAFESLRSELRSAGHPTFTVGDGPSVLVNGGLRLGPLICLEGLFPRFARAIVERGAQVFVNLTNDSWFGPGMEPELHLQLTAFRAVETRRPIVRVTNTGHTALIDIDGSLTFETPMDVENATVVDVPIYADSVSSPFMKIGDWFLGLAGLACAAFWLWRWRLSRRYGARPDSDRGARA